MTWNSKRREVLVASSVDSEKQEQRRVEQIIYDDEHDADFNEIYKRMAHAQAEEQRMRAVEKRAKTAIERAYYDREQGCMVTSVPCGECGRFHLQEVGFAVKCITSDEKLICAKCNPEATTFLAFTSLLARRANQEEKATSAFNAIGMRKVKGKVEELDWEKDWLDRDGCRVVMQECEGCRRLYQEEKGAAAERIEKGLSAVCIRCDGEADVASVTAVRVDDGQDGPEIWAVV